MAEREDLQTGLCKSKKRRRYMFDSSWRTDVNFEVGPEGGSRLISGHKLIMAAASPVFEAMLYGEMAEKVDAPIRIPDVDPDAFQVLLKHVYTDDITFETVDAAFKLCYAAEKYMMPDLVGECIRFVFLNLTAENACNVYEFANLLSVQFLKDKCLEIFKYYTETVLQSRSFAHSNRETVFAVLSLDEMNVPSEKFVFDRTLAWGLQQCCSKGHEPIAGNVRKELAEARVLFEIRYLTMTPAEFVSVSVESQLFSDEEALAILSNISVPGARAMPTSLSVTSEELSRQNRRRKRYGRLLFEKTLSNEFRELAFVTKNNSISLHGVVFDSCNDAALAATSQNILEYKTVDNKEEVHVKVYKQDNNGLYTLVYDYKFLVNVHTWGRNAHLCFPSPLQLQENSGYKLQITFKTSRAYYKFPKNPQETGVSLNPQGQSDIVPIHTIIYSYADVK